MAQLNKNILFKLLIFISLSIFYLISIVNNEMISYIDPKIVPFTICALILFLISSIFLITDIFNSDSKDFIIKNYIIFILALIILAVPKLTDYNTLPYNNITIENDTIIINSDNFISSICEILNDPEKYEDMNIEITGFVYKNNDDFIIARNLITDCLGNNKVTGLICEGYDLGKFDDDTWLNVRGTLKFDKDISKIIVSASNIELDLNPDTSYVFVY